MCAAPCGGKFGDEDRANTRLQCVWRCVEVLRDAKGRSWYLGVVFGREIQNGVLGVLEADAKPLARETAPFK